ncbi:hypothetical protein [Variovorax sp. YR634]|uniref:hypothetical protein n=1 Tax=Variovorax sp. YR634 TaxID=1884385 RepID=UPI00115FA6F6|nr:hypothetical protein [Variovorax sp. YR634]
MSREFSLPAPRSIEEQVPLLVEFLSVRSHELTAEQAKIACAGLPENPKVAAKELKLRLKPLGIDIQHTHALNAITRMRGTHIPAHLAHALRWDVAAWFSDAPSVGAKRRLHTKLSEAADDVCDRIRDQFEAGDRPLLRLRTDATHIELISLGDPSPHWHVLMVAVGPDGQPTTVPVDEIPRFAERLRRLLAGPISGWLDSFVGNAWESDVLGAWAIAHEDEKLPDQPITAYFGKLGPVSQFQWDSLSKRYAAFCDRLDMPYDMWLQSCHESSTARFAPAPFRASQAEAARVKLNLSVTELEAKLGFKDLDWNAAVKSQTMPSYLFAPVARVLQLESPNLLVEHVRTTPRIPLSNVDDLATWLARLDGEVVQYPDSPPVDPEVGAKLEMLLATPWARRSGWAKVPPVELKQLAQQVADAQLVICASMEARFVQDLPLGRWRSGMLSALSFESEAVVRTQGGALNVEPDVEGEPISAEWLERFNKQTFTGEDLMELSKEVEARREPDGDENFDIALFAAARLFKKPPGKAHAATVRMQAVSLLVKDYSLEPWVLASSEGGAVMLSRPIFEAAARCPLVDVKGEAGFEFRQFTLLCAEHAERKEVAS